jgi:hypothetical protein
MILSRLEKRNAIIAGVSARRHVPVRDIMGLSRQRDISAARHEAMALIRVYNKDTFKSIGQLFGRDHSTVIYAVAKHFGFERPSGSRIAGAAEIIEQGIAEQGEQLMLEARLYVQQANEAKHKARAANPLYGASYAA